MKKKNIPNMLSFLRILMVPAFVCLFLTNYPSHVLPAIIVFVAAGLTDIVDGYIARKYHWSTRFGRILDPFADKLLQASALVCLYIVGLVRIWVIGIYFIKEILLGIGAAVIFKKRKVVVKSNVFGKSATVLLFCAVFVISLFGGHMSRRIIDVIWAVVLGYIVFVFIIYFSENYKVSIKIKKSKSER